MKRKILNKWFFRGFGLMGMLGALYSCTDLEPQFTDSTSVEDASGNFTGVADIDASLEGLIGGIRRFGSQTNEYALMAVASEDIAVLTRGADWSDNGQWREMHNHTWGPNSVFILNSWNNSNQQVFNATQLIDPVSGADPDIVAQARVARAMNMFVVVNFFGVAPFRGVNDGPEVNPSVMSAQEAFDFIMDDLNSAIDSNALSTHGPDGDTFSIGEAVARFVRAKVLLNAETILGTAPANAYETVISDIDAIESLGYSLNSSESYFDIWDNSENTEVLFHINSFTGSRIFNQLHPNQGGWNGFVTLTETFRLYGTEDPSTDARIGLAGPEVNGVSVGILRGQQLNGSGEELTDRQNNALVFENEFLQSLETNNERTGLRVVKYPQRNDNGGIAANSTFVFMRFAEAVLMRAEARFRSGGDGTADVNQVRLRAGATLGLGSATLQDVYDEYRRELNGESNIAGQRANQIRFGTFTEEWELKTAQDDFRRLYPIPTNALISNPNLVQNEGY